MTSTTHPIKRIGIAIVVVYLIARGDDVRAELKGDPELLLMVVKEHRANLARLRTWQGTAHITDGLEQGGDPSRTIVNFSCDATQKYFRWHWDSEEKPGRKRTIVDGLVRDGRAYRLGHGVITEIATRKTHSSLIVRPLEDVKGHYRTEDRFDPIWYINRPWGLAIDGRYETVHKGRNHPKNDWGVSRDGDIVVLEIKSGNVGNRFEVDLSKGGNAVRVRLSETGKVNKYDITWQQVSGVWIPRVYTADNPVFEGGRYKPSIQTIEWVDNVINEPIDETVFSPDSLPLKPGDQVHDTSSGISYEYKASQAAVERIEGEIPQSRGRWILIGCLGIVLPLGGYLWWRRAGRT